MTELDDLRAAVREFLQAASPSGTVRQLMATEKGYDERVWRQMACELGLHGIAVPEEWGGAGAGMSELAVVFEEMGAALLCSPFFSTVALATQAILTSGDRAAMEEFLPTFVDGTSTATLILNGQLNAWDAAAVTLTAARDGDGYRVSGDAPLVLDGHTVDLLLVVANTPAGISLFAVAADSAGVEREPLASLDRTRKVARIRFDGALGRLIGTDGERGAGTGPHIGPRDRWRWPQSRSERRSVASTWRWAYAKDRIQFGRAIGSFQAIKHRCADMLVLVEGARSAVVHAAEVADGPDLATAAAVAKMTCSDAFLQVALDNMRIHGGIGFTWEHDAHLYVRRAKTTELIFGSPDYHAQRLADLVST